MKTCLMALHLLFTPLAEAQVEMADNLRAEGKIYVIVLIILIVLAGLFAYLFLLERKIKKLEERLK
jgi:hypothetical protein